MKPLFKSDALQKQFELDGFVQLKLISIDDANLLLQEYQKVADAHEHINIPYITTSHSNNAELINRVDIVLQKVQEVQKQRLLLQEGMYSYSSMV